MHCPWQWVHSQCWIWPGSHLTLQKKKERASPEEWQNFCPPKGTQGFPAATTGRVIKHRELLGEKKNHEENLIYFSCISLEVLSIMRAAVIASELINWLFHSIKASPLYWYSKDGRAGWVSKNLCRKSSNTWEFSPSGDGKQSQGKSQSTHGKSQIHILLLEYSPALCTVLFQDISVLTPQL